MSAARIEGVNTLEVVQKPVPQPAPLLYKLLDAKNDDWVSVLEQTSDITSAEYVCPSTHFTPLHLAVMAKSSRNNHARIGVVRSLLQSDHTAAEKKCKSRGYTPIMYACMITDFDQLEENLPIIRIMLDFCPEAGPLRCRNGYTALDIHIISMSRVMARNSAVLEPSHPKAAKMIRDCTKLLQLLLQRQATRDRVPARTPELLMSCNTLEIMSLVTREERRDSSRRLATRHQSQNVDEEQHASSESSLTRRRLPVLSGSQNLQYSWIWHFLLTMLRSEHDRENRKVRPIPPFNAVHVASRIDGMPVPLLILCKNAYPAQLQTPSPATSRLPLHSVAVWKDRKNRGRKSMALSQLARDFPAKHIKDKEGQTPLSLAISSGNTWESGIDCCFGPTDCVSGSTSPDKIK